MAEKKTAKNKGSAQTREDRLKAALKANMARRKAQAKARAVSDDSDSLATSSSKE
ncbi:hypothetical protein [Phaeobacter italicus]|jgi:hypothetical protein|uniref:hypothetical protein n=1 Tax=Phaeobacter italicus TaxID=481446 RepID=UPI000A913CF0|nr:hypothetical protein [Phaeobacter italicus]